MILFLQLNIQQIYRRCPPPLLKTKKQNKTKKTATVSLSSQNQSKANGEWVNHAAGKCSWYSHDSVTDASTIIVPHGESLPVAQPATDLATPKIWAYSHRSFGTRSRHFDYKAQSWVNKTLHTDRRLFFILLFLYFGFLTILEFMCECVTQVLKIAAQIRK